MQEPFGGLPSVSIIDLGDSRHGTPSRPPLPVRNHTPPRSASNPRSSNSALRRALASADKPDAETLDRAQGRSISRRKQRRWENKHLLGSEKLNQAILAAEADGDLENSKDELFGNLRIEWRSAFSELFEARNADALETFRQCAEQLSVQNYRPSKVYTSQSEEAWHRVSKRLRKLVVECLAENPAQLFPYLGALEDVLTHFCHHKELKAHDNDSKLAAEYLAAKMHVDAQKVLHVFVKDFKGNRYLLHAVCQFYHLQSKSYKKKGSKEKVTAVVAPRNLPVPAVQGLSITRYLLSTYFNQPTLAWSLDDMSAASSEVEDLADLLSDNM